MNRLIEPERKYKKVYQASEAGNQKTYIEWSQAYRTPNRLLLWDYLWHTPNGGERPKKQIIDKYTGMPKWICTQGNSLKALGVKPGIPDLFIAIPWGPWHGMFIEMKKDEKSSPTPDQKNWIRKLTERGFFCRICKNVDSAIKDTEFYFTGVI